MRILSLAAKNYRALEDIYVTFPTDYCTVSGQNNAGKSCLIRLLRLLLGDRPTPFNIDLDYAVDRTQWVQEPADILIKYDIAINHDDDPALVSFAEKLTKRDLGRSVIRCQFTAQIDSSERTRYTLELNDKKVSELDTREILRKMRSSNCLFLHNSTLHYTENIIFRRGRFSQQYPVVLSGEDLASIAEAEQALQRKIKRLTRAHKSELEAMIGSLKDRYEVEFTSEDSSSSRRVSFDVNLSDKSASVPLDDWGSGTQNRTRILMSILQAKRIKMGAGAEDRVTPIVVIEEPESFLHPNAQAEFGTLLQALSTELNIQIIASTHSPYMLNQANPSSNILLRRKTSYGKPRGSEIADTNTGEWMVPFADHLGVIPPEFESWRKLFEKIGVRVLLVEGETDREYFEWFREKYAKTCYLPTNVEVIAYNGKDALKNTAILRFVLSKVERAFITFDLDAADDVRKPLGALGLLEQKDFAAVGISSDGRDAIEGLLPDRVLSAVNGRELNLVMQLGSPKGRRDARSALKRKYLEELKRHNDLSGAELEPIGKLFRVICRKFD